MADYLSELFKQCSTDMERRGQTRLSDCFLPTGIDASIAEYETTSVDDIQQWLSHESVTPVEVLLAASSAGLIPTHQPPSQFPDNESCNQYLLQHLERRHYCIRTVQPDDLPALLLLEDSCWAKPLRTSETVLIQRIDNYPQGQLVLEVENQVVGVIYSQCIDNAEQLNGISVAEVDSLHNPATTTVQLLAVNILPQMQQHNLGDQLLEFMLIYRSLQPAVQSVVAITLCKNFDRSTGTSMDDYIRQRNPQQVLADPILRFHELHGAKIERVMPGYRPLDTKNQGCGVLVSYDIHHRCRKALPIETVVNEQTANKNHSRTEIRSYVQNAIGDCLGEQRKEAFAFDRPLMEMGLDSADLLELNEKIAHQYNNPLTPTFFFQYNTADKIVEYLSVQVGDNQQPADKTGQVEPTQIAEKTTLKRQQESCTDDIAIIGIACRLPGGINTPEDFWQCLQSGRSVVGTLPEGRWQWPDEIEPNGRHKGIDRGGFLDNITSFDAPFFRISSAEAESMDPQQRILLELSWQAIEHAGYAADKFKGSNTGVFIGASGSDYARLLEQCQAPVDAHYGTGSSMAVLANRLSYYYDFHGPSLLLDTACSSSLVAVHKAVQSIQSGESAQALVGGINLICHPANSIAYYKSGMLANDGSCKTFDQQANGYVRSEGAVMLLLKPMTAALADGDQIHALIKGTASNHGGQASGLTVPNPEQQAQLLQSAWQAAGIGPSALGYIEAHGTGTSLGDPIEVQGLKQAFNQAGVQVSEKVEKNCGLGSVKTNLGHLEAAAGITGLLKTLLCLQHRKLPASLNFKRLNEHIQLSNSGFYIVEQLQPWSPPSGGGPRFAGVSSFGSGGANAHAVLAEPPITADKQVTETDRPMLFVLSAKTRPQLQVYAQNFLDWLSADDNRSVSLTNLVYTLQTGRQAMEERLAFVVSNRQDLLEKLSAFCAPSAQNAPVFNSKTAPAQFNQLADGEAGQTFIRALIAQSDWDKIALLWLSGVHIDWSLLYGDSDTAVAHKIAAPTYPFAEHHYWLPGADREPVSNSSDQTGFVDTKQDNDEVVKPTLLAPFWHTIEDHKPIAQSLPVDNAVLIIGGNEPQLQAIRSIYRNTHAIAIDPSVSIASLSKQIKPLANIDHLIWIAPEFDNDVAIDQSLIALQNAGLLYVFKLVKALLAVSYGDKALCWTVITGGSQAVFNEQVEQPAHAGVHGLMGALAKEYPRWSIRAVDMETDRNWPMREILSLPCDSNGDVLAYRNGQWFKRVLSPVAALPDSLPVYRQQGVYLVVGGAGGIGEAWTRYVIEHYQAQVIWLGRRQPDAGIQSKLAKLAEYGPAPVYISADAADLDSLQAAYADIKQTWPQIHGVIHSAVGLFDYSLLDMDEQRFGDIVSAKIDISVNLAQLFSDEPLDFLLYFSSVVALEKSGGLSGYAAGGAFEDALALHLAKLRPYAVKVINWGHWDVGTGDAISDATKKRLQLSGIIPIQADEAMAVLQQLLAAPINQLALLKATGLQVLPIIDQQQAVNIYSDGIQSCIDRIPTVSADLTDRIQALKSLSLFNNTKMEAQLLPLLAGSLQALGLLAESDTASIAVTGFYRQWLAASRNILAEHGIDRPTSDNLDQLWQHWWQAKQSDFAGADIKAAVELVELCLDALPEILAGRTRATDVLFPDSSMRRVEDIYRNNAVADYFNDILAESLVSTIKIRLQQDPNAKLRIMEIGAGTGGTTATILPLLAPYSQHIIEYAYTDVSKAFLFHAEQQFVGDYPFVQPKLFDVEKPLAGQAIAGQSYDMVIATNVLHATRNIRQTLTNCKAALHKNGLLLLNEISSHSLFAHLTFGLLEGWWLSEDQCLRITDAPGLYPESWQTVLSQQGFKRVLFPAPYAHQLGQQIIVAESDGIASQQQPAQQTAPSAAVCAIPKPVETGNSENLKQASNDYLKKLVAKSLRMDSADIDALEPLETYGIDSILVMQITNALRGIFPDVGSTLLFECQTVDALSDYFIRHNQNQLIRLTGLAQQSVSSAPVASRAQTVTEMPAEPSARSTGNDRPRSDSDNEAIAVIGVSCRFPQADTVDQYWQLLKTGQNCIREVPAERWPLSGFYHADPDQAVAQGKSYSKWGGFLDNVTDFDPLFFNISPKEAIAIDPQERLFLQTVWETLEDAGYTRDRLVNECRQQVGVFAGITRTGFDLFGPSLWRHGNTLYPHTSFSSVANRVSYFLNAHGPSVPVDTMCSSSLTAIHQACQSLRSNECRVAIAGGVNIYLHPSGYVGLSASRMLSEDGVCRSFGKGGNGFVPGEGVGAVLLKPLSEAIADNDRIYATIRASQVNHGGKTNGYTVPNPKAQAELIQDAMHKAGVDARAVSYIEAHGTGTELGDPIEVSGLTQAFRQFTQDNGFCALGSAKSNVGHLEAAAGIAGFIKVILQLRHKQLVPSLHATELNPNINFAQTPFIVQQSLTDWQRPVLMNNGVAVEQPRIAGISSFGAGGANAHVIVEEYQQAEPLLNTDNQPCMVLLSAKNQERLKAYVAKLQLFIERQLAVGDAPALQDLAYTLQVGREQMDHRLALVVKSLPQLQQKLQAYLSGQQGVADLYQGQVKQHKELIAAFTGDDAMQLTLSAWFVQRKYARLLNLWSKGLQIDWDKLYQAQAEPLPKRISAPTYPFTETAYWFPVEPIEDISEAVPEKIAIPKPTVQAAVLADSSQVRTEKAERQTMAKPSHIKLANLSLVSANFPPPAARQPICLSPLQGYDSASVNTDPTEIPGSAGIALYDHSAGVFAIKVNLVDGKPVTIESACTGLINCLQQINTLVDELTGQGATPKALLLTGLEQLFAFEDTVTDNALLAQAIAAIAGCRVPVIAVLNGENRHYALLMAAACDVMVCSKTGLYRFAAPVMSEVAQSLFAYRFGKSKAALLAESKSFTGDQLLVEAGLTLAVVDQAELDSYTLTLARSIAQLSVTAVIELKQHLNADTSMLLENPSAVSVDNSVDYAQTLAAGFVWPANGISNPKQKPEPVALNSDVVTLQKYSNGVVVVNLHDRSSKNTFSAEFVNGVSAAFEHINNTPEYKAVVLIGYDSYFACGGTKKGLLDIQNGTARFTDEQSYSMPLLCEVPVIAAMQGHAIGAGWAMGLFCDCAVYSEESVYQSPYMRYGFTPGAGSTLIFPYRLGYDLSREVLLSAEEFQGRMLKQHNIDSPVLPRSQVFDYALALGHHLAQSSRQQLVQQKNIRSKLLRQRLPSVFEAELAMHDKTFVGQQTVIDNINRHFNDSGEQNQPEPVAACASSTDQTSDQLLATLRQSLTEELQMQQEQVDDDTTFIDMGMDSITAVTWVRKVNKQFGLSIGATKVYSYPTLNLFADYVSSQLPQPMQQEVTNKVEKTSADAEQLLTWLGETLAKELLMTPDMIDLDCKFIDMGLDSITAVTWIRAINKHYGLSVGATKVYSYPTLDEFYQYLLTLVGEQQGPLATRSDIPDVEHNPSMERAEKQISTELPEPALLYTWPLRSVTQQPRESSQAVQAEAVLPQQPQPVDTNAATQSIAIIGMSGQFPKAENISQFWQNLLQGRECISGIPATRWAIDEYYNPDRNAPGKTVCKRMGLLDDIDVFDPLFFNISPSEAEYMDPQQRLFLQNSWRCIEDAGYDPTKLSGSLCGVFVGCAVSDYAQLMADQPHSAQLLMGESVSMLPARIAYFLNLQGPSLAIDTACSSSLVALANACDSLVLGHSDMALAGGVYIINGPDIQVKMSSAGMLSPDGRCFSFDQRANGFVPGEGVGVLLLKRLADAERDGDDIYGVIRGWGINQDGKSNGITAPNQAAQTRLETGIYQKFDINPEHIQLVEAHGTGTKLGDPIEVEALRETFKQFTDKRNYCALGSVKSNIGHLATAAGVTGVIKSVLALSHKQLPPTINYQSLNEHIDLQGSPFYINSQCQPWPEATGQKRLATVSSFGFSGTNAHMVLAESTAKTPSVSTDATVLLVLSAKSEQQLAVYAQDVCDYLEHDFDSQAVTLADLAYTFQTGRAEMNCRLAVLADTVDALKTRLSAFAATGLTDDNCITGQVGEFIGQQENSELRQLAERWLTGETVDWSTLYQPGQAQRKHGLPTYPFAREHYWVPEAESIDLAKAAPPSCNIETLPVKLELWQESALPEAMDWGVQLQSYQDKQLMVIYTDDSERQAFSRLLRQLKQAAGLTEGLSGAQQVHYYPITEIDTASTAKQPDCLLFLSGHKLACGDGASLVQQWLSLFTESANPNPVQRALLLTAEQDQAERLVELVNEYGQQPQGLLLTLSGNQELTVTMQRLFTEWLALATSQPAEPLRQVHYAGERRLLRQCVTEPDSDRIHLIKKLWQPKKLQPLDRSSKYGTVLILVNHESLEIAKHLLKPEDFKEIVLIGDNSVAANQIQNSIDFKDTESIKISANILIDQYDDISHIIDLGDLYRSAKDKDADNPGKVIFYQTIIGTFNDIALLYLSKGLQHFQTQTMSLAGAKFAGLVKMISADYPHISARLIDIDQTCYEQPQQLRQIVMQEFAGELQETELCYRNGQRFAPMLSAVATKVQEQTPLPIAQDGVYVISGGTNGVGLEIAKYLVSQGCNKLVLMGVTPLPPKDSWKQAESNDDLTPYVKNKLPALVELDKAVEQLQIYTGSITSLYSLKRYFKKIRAKLGPIRGVIHAAGVYSDADNPGFVGKNLARMQQVWEPKINGLECLHTLFKTDALDFFVTLSSVTGVIPHMARGAGDYAMANSFVDLFTAYQYHQNKQSHYKTLIWSDWNQTGAITRIAADKVAMVEDNFHRLGLRTFSNQEGCALFERAMGCYEDSTVFIGYLDPGRFYRVRSQLLFARMDIEPQEQADKVSETSLTSQDTLILSHLEHWEAEKRSGLDVSVDRITEVIDLAQIKQLPPNLIHRIHKLLFATVPQQPAETSTLDLEQTICHTVQEVLKLKQFDPTQPFQNYGLDSISAMVLATRLEKKLQRTVQPQWLIDYATVETLSNYLLAQSSTMQPDKHQ